MFTTTKNFKSLLTSIKCLNRYDFSFELNCDDVTDEFIISFQNSKQCAMLYSLLQEMLIDSTSITLKSGYEIEVLVIHA